MEEHMATFKGLLYVKHGAVGTRSEGPVYYLQTRKADFVLHYTRDEHHPWELDYQLEFYARRMVDVEGEETERGHIHVKHLRELCVPMIPEEE